MSRRKKNRFFVAVLCLTAAVACPGCRKTPDAAPAVTIGGHRWTVELATTPKQQYQGLSDRTRLDADGGMLFIFPRPQVLTFCMRKCLIPLDIAFIGPDMRVVKTHTMTVEPYGEEIHQYSSAVPAVYALEVNAGDFQRWGIHEGDAVTFSAGMLEHAHSSSE